MAHATRLGQADAACWNNPRYIPPLDARRNHELSQSATRLNVVHPPGTDQ
jgi:hypothetical protein